MNSVDQQHQRLNAIADGREATAIAGLLRPYIDDRILKLVHLTVARYRQGTASYEVLLGTAAQMSCLMDLLSDLDSRARRGDIAMNKEMEDAKNQRNDS